MNIGDHLVTPRFGYTHHGLYMGDGKVIHYAGFANERSKGKIAITSLAEFSNGHSVHVEDHLFRVYDAQQSVERALQRLGEDWYNVLLNNCEHFVTWCIQGFHSSSQVNDSIIAIAEAYAKQKAKEQVQRTVATAVMKGVAQKETARQVAQVFAPSLAKSVVSTSAGAAAYVGMTSTTGTAVTAAIASTASVPLLPAVAVVGGVFLLLGCIFD